MTQPQLNFSYLHSAKIGYGHQGIETHKALTEIGIDVYDGLPGSGDIAIDEKKAKVCRDVLFLTIPSHVSGWWEGQRAHIFTMFETSEVPETFRESLHNFDTVLVPSQVCLEMFSKYHDNVKYVPLGVDGERWHFQERNREGVFFNFLIAGSGARKGNDLAHQAFLKVFGGRKTNGPVPQLLIKSPKNEQYEGENVKVFGGYMPAEDETALYASAHCYLQPSRGEGWGMQPLQALSQGCPTILTNAHGHVPFAKYGIPLSWTFAPATYMKDYFGESGDWWEPDFDELCQQMADVYDNYDHHVERARVNSELVRAVFTWQKSAEAIVDAIGGREVLSEVFTPPTFSSPEWVSPNSKRFKVVTLRDWKADIGGVTYFFAKGQEYHELADVKRVMFESGVLDPQCLVSDDGLTEDQVKRMGTQSAKYYSCPTCGQETQMEFNDAIRI